VEIDLNNMHLVVLTVLATAMVPANAWIWNIIKEAVVGGDYEGAPYTVAWTYHEDSESNKYEERVYPARKWVCHDETVSGSSSGTSSFMKLFRYISGTNERNQEIKMTVPVTSQWTPSTGGKYVVSMCFYLEAKDQADPPAPTTAGVYIQDRPEITIYTRQFGGWPSSRFYQREKEEFTDLLIADGKKVVKNTEYRVSYDSPMKLFNRRNELWLVKAE